MSDFDVRRLHLEVEGLEVRASELEAELRAGWIRMATLTGLEMPAAGWTLAPPPGQPGGPPPLEDVDSVGGAAPSSAPPTGAASRETERGGPLPDAGTEPVGRPEIRAARQRRRAAAIREELTRREALPDLVFTAGYSRIDPGHDGLVWSVRAVLPLFDRNRAAAAAAAEEEGRLRRRVETLENEARSQRLQALEAYRGATAALRALEVGPEDGLAQIARIAYQEGAMGVVELVDAVQAELAAAIRRAELEQRRNDRWFVWKWASGRALQEVDR